MIGKCSSNFAPTEFNDSFEGGATADTFDLLGGDDLLRGGDGADTYVINRGSDADTVDNIGHGADGDRVLFGAGIAQDQLWFSQSGNDLSVSIIGTGDKVTVSDWYLDAGANQVSRFELADGSDLLAAQVQTLVDAMAAEAAPAFGVVELTAGQHATLDPIIVSSWDPTV